MTSSVKFWDRAANSYSKAPISDQRVYNKKLAITRDYLTPESQVLEFGCGTGSTAMLHSPFVKHIHAIDVSNKMLAIANANSKEEAIDNISFEQTSIEQFNAQDDSYDAVLGLNILHLLEDKKAAIAKVHKMLKPGGVFVSSTMCGGSSFSFMRFFLKIGGALGLLPKVNYFSQGSLQMGLQDAGFQLTHVWSPDDSDTAFIVAKKTS
ncbi:MAG: methyltransferase domain-containing protein [Kordiimonadaceae bacterium]|jgi:ubiquinone/menaquinone biosynthesis C-methylase UbiE|nr:methyltransferase domain-containing protein [Kordiimonadaceae bacterium]MBT6036615.1 methyltransferase domain-containing protein [Kordiimonadaceae bacterium]MBT6328325.1 methyltransferase domain-containing protein [Kordiimonadaceae bacterium]